MKKRLAILVFCLLISVSSASAEAPLTERLPGGSLAYVGWAGSNLTFDGSMFGQMVREPSFVKLLGSIRSAIEVNMPEGTTGEMFQGGWDLAAITWGRPCAAALIDLTFDESGQPDATVAVIIDLGNKREQFVQHLDGFIAAVSEQYSLEFQTVTTEALTYKRLKDIPLSYGFMGDVFFVAYGEGVPQKLIDLSPEGALSVDEKFSAAYKVVSGESVQLACYVDVASLIDRAETVADEKNGLRSKLIEFTTAITKMGLAKVNTIAGSISVLDRGLHSKIRIQSPAPHRGILMLTAGPPLTDDDLSVVPADADYFTAARLSPAGVYSELREVIKSIEPSADTEFQAAVDKIETELGLSINDDVLACLGDSWVVCSAPSQGGFLTGTVLSATITDAQKLAASLAKIEKYIVDNLPPGSLMKTSAGRVEVHYVSFASKSFVPVAPAWAIYEDRFYLALWPQVIQSTIQNVTTPIVADAKFAQWRAMVADKPSVMTYSNLPKIARQLYNIALLGWTVAAGQLSQSTPIAANPDWLPALSAIEKYLWPNISTISADATGVTIESYGSLPFGGLATMWPTSPLMSMSSLLLHHKVQPEQSPPKASPTTAKDEEF